MAATVEEVLALAPESDGGGYRSERMIRADLARQLAEGKAQTQAEAIDERLGIRDVPTIDPGTQR